VVIDIEAIADSVHIRFDDKVTVILDRSEAANFGAVLLHVSTVGGDTLDELLTSD
jgi:hypothetical protein